MLNSNRSQQHMVMVYNVATLTKRTMCMTCAVNVHSNTVMRDIIGTGATKMIVCRLIMGILVQLRI